MSGNLKGKLFVPPFARVLGSVVTPFDHNQAMAQIERALAIVQGLALTAIYGEMTISANAVATSLPTQNAWVPVTAGWGMGDDFSGMKGDTVAGSLTSYADGTYPFATIVSLSVKAGTGGATYQFGIFKNGVLLPEHSAELTIGAGEETSISMTGIDHASKLDAFTVQARCTTTAATSVTVVQANMSMWSIAGPGT